MRAMPARIASLALLLPLLTFACRGRVDQPGQELRVTLSEWAVHADPAELRPGPVRIVVVNAGEHGHSLEVERQNGDEWETSMIAPGDDDVLELELERGTYTLYCPVHDDRGDHRALGMTTTVQVR
jgi:plastocyanin